MFKIELKIKVKIFTKYYQLHSLAINSNDFEEDQNKESHELSDIAVKVKTIKCYLNMMHIF